MFLTPRITNFVHEVGSRAGTVTYAKYLVRRCRDSARVLENIELITWPYIRKIQPNLSGMDQILSYNTAQRIRTSTRTRTRICPLHYESHRIASCWVTLKQRRWKEWNWRELM